MPKFEEFQRGRKQYLESLQDIREDALNFEQLEKQNEQLEKENDRVQLQGETAESNILRSPRVEES